MVVPVECSPVVDNKDRQNRCLRIRSRLCSTEESHNNKNLLQNEQGLQLRLGRYDCNTLSGNKAVFISKRVPCDCLGVEWMRLTNISTATNCWHRPAQCSSARLLPASTKSSSKVPSPCYPRPNSARPRRRSAVCWKRAACSKKRVSTSRRK